MTDQTATINSNTPSAIRPHLETLATATNKASDYLLLMFVVAALLFPIEIFVYSPIVHAQNYLGEGWQNTLLSIGIPLIPVFGSVAISELIGQIRAGDGSRAFWVIAIVGVLAVEALFFWRGWILRVVFTDSEGFAVFLNIVAITFFVIALLVEIFLSKKRQLLLAGAEISRLHAAFNSTERSIAPYSATSSIDLNRIKQDFTDFIKCFWTIADNVLLNFDLSRDANSKLYSSSPEMGLRGREMPYYINGNTCVDRDVALAMIIAYLGAPDDGQFRPIYGPDLNTDLDKYARESNADFSRRYNEIINAHKGITEY